MDKLWFVAIGALLALVMIGGPEAPEAEPAPSKSAPDPAPRSHSASPRAGNGSARFTATRAADGHFYADARVNGAEIRMLIDTGASSVVLSRRDAQRAGIQARSGEFTVIGSTAGGEIALKPVTIDRMALGAVSSRNVPAVVAERELQVSLLGQSFLERVGNVEIDGDEMRLR